MGRFRGLALGTQDDLGTGMGHPQRWYLPRATYEVTVRAMQGLFLLRPDDQSREIVNGVIARALERYPNVQLHAFDCQANHLHQELSSTDGVSIPHYLGYVHGNIARAVGRLRGWEGHFWSRRGRVISIVDDAAVIARFRYVVAQGVAAGLVASPRDWLGASSTPALLGDMTMRAAWLSRDAMRRNSRLAKPKPIASLVVPLVLRLTPIPPWAHLTPSELRERHESLVRDIEQEHAGCRVRGAARMKRQNPFGAPTKFVATPAPACHASSRAHRDNYQAHYRLFRSTFIAAAGRLRANLAAARESTGIREVAGFPLGSLPRPSWYVAPPADMLLPWCTAFAA